MKDIKKLNEVKPGDILYCIAYSHNGKEISIVEITVKEVITDGPDIKRHIYSREAILVKEKVPNSPEPAGEYVIDQYYRGDECMTHSHGIYTTFIEAATEAQKEIDGRFKLYSREEEKYTKKKLDAFSSLMDLHAEILKKLKEEEV